MNPKVTPFFTKAKQWREEMEKLRAILVEFPLTEEVKWGKPCYTLEDCNLIILQGFKESCAILFCKGALLKDPKGLLEKPGANTQSAMRMSFKGVNEIVKAESALKALIKEAIAVEKAGLKVEYKKISERAVPEELRAQLEKNKKLKAAFEALTPGRQRMYYFHISSAKQAHTRVARVEKCIPLILEGKGLND